MEQLKRIGRYILRKFSKIQLAIIVVLIICCFVIGDSNIFSRFGYDLEIHNLKTQIEYYQEKTETDKRKLNELRSDKDNIEKFARENYLMKRENEEVFIIE
ncbi:MULTISPECIES: FtsB family cell division protein [unclassified Dysgonomonas]|uniref:FtsB family cell division protein n=1 Tax=unclassified Dysgonomonas TaxID=2630389 RepID=UPI000681D982|nr:MULTISPECIES: septum formation initiator family protein [unclassified Dysgonomonas]MBD8349539.1 septum formation initiator family protein [Dysgonomonas sp. HGC4]MBF0577860.1 septum formation initiator family protein [Dysgonomonas sp. GY617]